MELSEQQCYNYNHYIENLNCKIFLAQKVQRHYPELYMVVHTKFAQTKNNYPLYGIDYNIIYKCMNHYFISEFF